MVTISVNVPSHQNIYFTVLNCCIAVHHLANLDAEVVQSSILAQSSAWSFSPPNFQIEKSLYFLLFVMTIVLW